MLDNSAFSKSAEPMCWIQSDFTLLQTHLKPTVNNTDAIKNESEKCEMLQTKQSLQNQQRF